MRTNKVLYAVLAILIFTWPISIVMNVFLINHVDEMQYQIDVRDSLTDRSHERGLDWDATLDSLKTAVNNHLTTEGCR